MALPKDLLYCPRRFVLLVEIDDLFPKVDFLVELLFIEELFFEDVELPFVSCD